MDPRARRYGQRRSLDQLQHEGLNAISLLELVNRRDVRVVQRGEDVRFALEAREAIGVRRERGLDFDRHVAIQPGIACPEDLAHAAGPEKSRTS